MSGSPVSEHLLQVTLQDFWSASTLTLLRHWIPRWRRFGPSGCWSRSAEQDRQALVGADQVEIAAGSLPGAPVSALLSCLESRDLVETSALRPLLQGD